MRVRVLREEATSKLLASAQRPPSVPSATTTTHERSTSLATQLRVCAPSPKEREGTDTHEREMMSSVWEQRSAVRDPSCACGMSCAREGGARGGLGLQTSRAFSPSAQAPHS
jgi:hypothetical protein